MIATVPAREKDQVRAHDGPRHLYVDGAVENEEGHRKGHHGTEEHGNNRALQDAPVAHLTFFSTS